MRRTIISLWVVSLCACSAGPSGPYEYTAPAVNLHVRLADLPAGNVAHAWLTAYLLEEDSGSLSQQQTGSAFTPVSADDVDFQLLEAGARATIGSFPDLRFFQIFVGLSDSAASYDGYPGNWGQPGLFLAYAVRPTSWSLFGPASQSVTFPQGYFWLRRTCALQPGQIQMEVQPVDEVVELRPMDSAVVNGTLDAQASEKSFLASCGVASLSSGPRITPASTTYRLPTRRTRPPLWACDRFGWPTRQRSSSRPCPTAAACKST